MPSVYGSSQRHFAKNSPDDIRVVEESEFIFTLADEIKRRIEVQKDDKTAPLRAVIVFFDDKETLNALYNSEEFRQTGLRDRVRKLLSDGGDKQEKDNLIQTAASTGSITFSVREFGRGTDFKCFDDQLTANGGVHVIQAFVSTLLSEETQIMGRTARQGDRGSYSMVIKRSQLETIKMTSEDIDTMIDTNKLYETLDRFRSEFFREKYEKSKKNMDDVKSKHQESMRFVDNIANDRIHEAKEFLIQTNHRG
jgi:preprotein translocase subunit SecA